MRKLDTDKISSFFLLQKLFVDPSYLHAIEWNLTILGPWYLLDHEEIVSHSRGLKSRYPGKFYIPFARRQDTDDVACFSLDKSNDQKKVVAIIHDYAQDGWESGMQYDSFANWVIDIIDKILANDNFID